MRETQRLERIIGTDGKPFYRFEEIWESDEEFVPGFPISSRRLTADEVAQVKSSGDPGVIQWPQLMLPPHIGDEK
jgi:hypothetical protein